MNSNLIVWPGYAESGANVPEYDWVHPFETKTGCKVKTIKEAGSSDEMVTLMRQGGGPCTTACPRPVTPRSA